MKKIVLILLFALLSLVNSAQFIDNKLHIYIGYSMGSYFGKETVNEDNYITPSLYSNYHDLSGPSIEAFYKIKPRVSIGFIMNYNYSSDWKAEHYTDFEDSQVSLFSFSPSIQFHNKYSKTGFFNRIKFFVNVAPNLGIAKIELKYPVFDIHNGNILVTDAMQSNDFIFGIYSEAGIEFTLTHLFGFYLNESFQYNRIASKLYNDKNVICSKIGFGVILRLRGDKNYLY